MSAGSDEEKAAKAEALKLANRGATEVPLRRARALRCRSSTSRRAPPRRATRTRSATPAWPGSARMAGAEAAWYNVLINLNGIEGDDEWVAGIRERADKALVTAEEKAAGLRKLVRDRLRAGA